MNYESDIVALLATVEGFGAANSEELLKFKEDEIMENILEIQETLLKQADRMFYYLHKSLETIPGHPDMLSSYNNYQMEGIAHDMYNLYLGDCGCKNRWFDGCLFRND